MRANGRAVKSGMWYLCDGTAAGRGMRKDNILALSCIYPPFRYPLC